MLVIVPFLDGSERWGTTKSERYKKSEQSSEIKYGRTVGRYNFTEFDQLVKNRSMVSEFSPYIFSSYRYNAVLIEQCVAFVDALLSFICTDESYFSKALTVTRVINSYFAVTGCQFAAYSYSA